MEYVSRDLEEKFEKINEIYPVVAVVGPRQAGKTTFLRHMSEGKRVSYVLFDDPDVRNLFEDVKKFQIQYVDGYELTVLDEVQYSPDPGLKLKFLADTGHKLWITSSSEIILRKEVLSYLVGRVAILRLYPFNLQEVLRAKGIRAIEENILRRIVWEHVTYGGYPRVVLTEDSDLKRIILENLYDTMLLKDVVHTFSIENSDSMAKLVRILASSSGPVNYSTLSQMLNISFQTVKKYLSALKMSYFITEVLPFSTNPIKEITKQPKLYFLDTGLKNIVRKRFSSNVEGTLFENYILTELIKAGYQPKYWRTKAGAEVDFIVEKDGEIIPIEVKITATLGKLERGFRSFIEKYSPKRGYVVSYEGESGIIKVDRCKVKFVNVLELISELNGGNNLKKI